jgi:hypothetical protein
MLRLFSISSVLDLRTPWRRLIVMVEVIDQEQTWAKIITTVLTKQ